MMQLISYKNGAAEESYEKMIVVYADAIYCHSAVMIILYAAFVAY